MPSISLSIFNVGASNASGLLTQAKDAIKSNNITEHHIIGPDIKDANTLQLLWIPSASSTISSIITPIFGAPSTTITADLDQDPFSATGISSSPVIELVWSWFPASQVTRDFQKEKEADFAKFYSIIVSKRDLGNGIAKGWSGEAEHEEIQGEKGRCWFIMRGWESVEKFDEQINVEEFKEAIPILMAWKAPAKLWHIENKISA